MTSATHYFSIHEKRWVIEWMVQIIEYVHTVKKEAMSENSVFVVDDDPAVCRAISRLLRSHGYTVRSFSSAEAFLEESSDQLPDCLVLDVQMPGTNGLELQAHLAESGAAIPVIIITALGTDATRDAALSRGASAFIEKPVPADALLAAVRQATTS